MDQLYTDKQYISLVLEQLNEVEEDLEKISVYNGDFLNSEVSELAQKIFEIKTKINGKVLK